MVWEWNDSHTLVAATYKTRGVNGRVGNALFRAFDSFRPRRNLNTRDCWRSKAIKKKQKNTRDYFSVNALSLRDDSIIFGYYKPRGRNAPRVSSSKCVEHKMLCKFFFFWNIHQLILKCILLDTMHKITKSTFWAESLSARLKYQKIN